MIRNRRRPLRVESLERRNLLFAFALVDTVADDDDPATTSLRDAIEIVNSDPNGGRIDFDIPAVQEDPLIGRFVIEVTSPLPDIVRYAGLSGFGQAATNTPPIQIDGSLLTGTSDGLRIHGDGSSLELIAVANFPGDGIETIGASSVDVRQTHLFGNGRNGIRFNDSAGAAFIASDTYLNGASGVQLTGTSADATIAGNRIGGFENPAGFVPAGNGTFGIHVLSPRAEIFDNTVSDNGSTGVAVSAASAIENQIYNNRIGTDPSGENAIPNGSYGVLLKSSGNIVGNPLYDPNVISGNARSGVVISGAAASGNYVISNLIGTDSTGTAPIPNGAYGVLVTGGASGNEIGGVYVLDPSIDFGNVVSGNSGAGIALSGGAHNNLVQSNNVGLQSNGIHALGNGSIGVYLRASANNNEVSDNFIAGNSGAQVSIVAASTTANTIHRNEIGYGTDGIPVPGGSVAVLVKAPGNTIGGPAFSDGNYIAGSNTGISVSSPSANNNEILSNQLGSRGATFPPTDYGMVTGVQFVQGAHDNLLEGNLIDYNSARAVRVPNSAGINNQILFNSMYGNNFGIDLGSFGRDVNDPADADPGPNRLQNSPVILDVQTEQTSKFDWEVTLEYLVDTDPENATYPLTIDFYSSDSVGQGIDFLFRETFIELNFDDGSATVFTTIDTNPLLVPLEYLTATATDASGNTSEFALPVPIDTVSVAAAEARAAAALPAPADATTTFDSMDVNADRKVTASDALMVINDLGIQQIAGEFTVPNQRSDVNGDGVVSALDALAIINRLAHDRAQVTDERFTKNDELENIELGSTLF